MSMNAALALALAVLAPSQQDAAEHRFGFAAVPTATFNTDEGFGTGGVATLYHHHGEVLPYRDAITFNLFISSKLVQAHAITWDALKPFDVAGRLLLRLGYYSTVSQNYCGVGNEVDCAPAEATAAARARGLVDGTAAFDDFTRRYWLMRFVRPHATVLLRPWLRDKPWRVELLLGWRGALTFPGELDQWTPYPGSRFALDHPDGEPGVSSAPLLGIIVDDRDAETFPTRGVFVEASVRAAHPWWGSRWTWAGVNASASYFAAFSRAPRMVLATRVLGDAMVGEPSTEELARIGGTNEWIAFGGHVLGRGIREHRYLGKLKAVAQAELRAQLVQHELWGERFDHGAALFSDVGFIGYDLFDLRGQPARLLSGVGLSYRLLWNESFAIRADLAVSPDEAEGPGFYVIVGQAF